MKIALSLLALIFSIVVHEVAHGWVALRFGDPTAKRLGRLTLNPIPHVDLLGSIILPALFIVSGSGFILGWAKPVPVDTSYFTRPIKDMMWVAIAGPLSNFSMAVIASLGLKFLVYSDLTSSVGGAIVGLFFKEMVIINVVLGVFNLFPIPPLDGSKVLLPFLSYSAQTSYLRVEPYGFLIILGLAYFGILDTVLIAVVRPILMVLSI